MMMGGKQAPGQVTLARAAACSLICDGWLARDEQGEGECDRVRGCAQGERPGKIREGGEDYFLVESGPRRQARRHRGEASQTGGAWNAPGECQQGGDETLRNPVELLQSWQQAGAGDKLNGLEQPRHLRVGRLLLNLTGPERRGIVARTSVVPRWFHSGPREARELKRSVEEERRVKSQQWPVESTE